MSLDERQLKELAVQEARFFSRISTVSEEECGIFLFAPEFPDYVSANRALALRDDGRGAKAVAETVITFYHERGIRPAAELDAVAESQGIGSELRRRGLHSTVRKPSASCVMLPKTPPVTAKAYEVKKIPNHAGR